ncbi:MAG: PAC2 family protein [Phycisphaerales bacterium]|nr:PAC2 family protein [Phycisphaerales bacterium]
MTESQDQTQRPYLLAAWPGMGNVAVIAAGYLAKTLGLEQFGTIPLIDFFDLNHVAIRGGIIERPHLPRGLLFRTPETHQGRPIIVFLGEAQPSHRGYAFVHALLERLRDQHIERVFTFASLAAPMHPTDPTRVHAAATSRNLLPELAGFGIDPTGDGQIGGLNGLLLGAASERELDGVGLMAEIPFYAAKVPNHKAARAVLGAFCEIAGIEVDFSELDRHAEAGERAILRLFEQLQRAQSEGAGDSESPRNDPLEAALEDSGGEPESEPGPEPADRPDPAVIAHIEELFAAAQENRRVAFDLKAELDNVGLFKQYEDRFLDLFKHAD